MTAMPTSLWPVPAFDPLLCSSGDMSDRERLGMPEGLLVTALQEDLRSAIAGLRTVCDSELLERVGDRGLSLAERIAAGNLLALAGDPRIDPLNPAMVLIPGGDVEIGLDPAGVGAAMARLEGLGLDHSWIEKECPRHRTRLAPFALARFPVTNGEYRKFLIESGHSKIPTSWHFRRFPVERANHPVYTVSAEAADAYASWLSERTGRDFRLPTEAEWEFAATGREEREFPWGELFDPELANTAECGLFDTSPVGAFAGGESPFGVSDMGGNVEEYVADEYMPYPGGQRIEDHLVIIHGSYRVARGGGFSRFRDLARTRRRHGHNPRSATYAMGFRLAETPPSAGGKGLA